MKPKSATQKLNVDWSDRSWSPRIESHAEVSSEPVDRVAIYNTADKCLKSDTQLIVRNCRVVQRPGSSLKQAWKN